FPGEHVSQKRVGSDVERHAEENVRTALVQLEIEPAGGQLSLEQAVAGRERHLRNFTRVPGGDDLPPRIGIAADQLHEVGDLVDVVAVRRLPIAPLLAVDRAEVAAFIGPLVPDADLSLIEPADVRVTTKEPEQ